MATITTDEVHCTYEIGKKFCAGELTRTQGVAEINRICGTNKTSVSNMLGVMQSMLNGKEYHRTINLYATEYYLEKIGEDYGWERQQKAAQATLKHIEYYAGLENGSSQQEAKEIAISILRRTKG